MGLISCPRALQGGGPIQAQWQPIKQVTEKASTSQCTVWAQAKPKGQGQEEQNIKETGVRG